MTYCNEIIKILVSQLRKFGWKKAILLKIKFWLNKNEDFLERSSWLIHKKGKVWPFVGSQLRVGFS